MDTLVIVALIALIQGIGVAIINGLINKTNRDNEEYRKRREERDGCLYDLIFASASGTEVLLHNAHGEKMNGNVDKALASIEKAKGECNRVFNHQIAKL